MEIDNRTRCLFQFQNIRRWIENPLVFVVVLVLTQVVGVVGQLLLSNLAYQEQIDLGGVVFIVYFANLLLQTIASIVFERRCIWSQLRSKDVILALICGLIGPVQQFVYVESFGLIHPDTSSTVALVVPIAVVLLDCVSSIWTGSFSTGKAMVQSAIAVSLWSCAAFVSYPTILKGHTIFGQPLIDHIARQPPLQKPSWATITWNVPLCFLGSAPLATWLVNVVKENYILQESNNTSNVSYAPCYSFTVLFLSYLPGSIIFGINFICRGWKKMDNDLVAHKTLMTVLFITIPIFAALTALSSWVVQRKGASFAAPFTFIYLVGEVIALPLLVLGDLHLRSMITAALLVGGILVKIERGGDNVSDNGSTSDMEDEEKLDDEEKGNGYPKATTIIEGTTTDEEKVFEGIKDITIDDDQTRLEDNTSDEQTDEKMDTSSSSEEMKETTNYNDDNDDGGGDGAGGDDGGGGGSGGGSGGGADGDSDGGGSGGGGRASASGADDDEEEEKEEITPAMNK